MEPVERQFHVVLDVSDVLAAEKVIDESFFLHERVVTTAKKTHYVFPFAFEFLQLLFKQKDVKVSFFNDGDLEETQFLVETVLQQALGKKWCEENKGRIALRSLGEGCLIKDLSTFETGIPLKDTVLVEDKLCRRADGQERNILKVLSFQSEDFVRTDKYNSDGYRKIPCYLYGDDKISDKDQKKCLYGNCILVKKNAGKHFGFFVQFIDSHCNRIEHPIDGCNWKLNVALRRLLSKRIYRIEDPDILDQIYRLVIFSKEGSGGKVTKVCRRINRICFIAGVLFSSLDTARRMNEPLTKSLSRWQYVKYEGESHEEPRFDEIATLDHLYKLGLGKLRLVNSELRFISPATEFINI